MGNIKNKIHWIYQKFEPFRNILWFLFLFILLEFLWKLFINEGEYEGTFLVLGKDFSSWIDPLNIWTADIIHWIVVHIFGYADYHIEGTTIFFDNSLRLRIVWECTGIKQIIIFTILILLYFGPVKHKLWFIPVSMVILNFINILRILAIAFITKNGFPDWFIPFNEIYNNRIWGGDLQSYRIFYTDWFDLFHKDIFRWVYYGGVMFILWLIWEEAFNLPYQKRKKEKASLS